MGLAAKIAVEAVVLCLAFWLMCFLGTGGDKKNIKGYASYPDAVQDIVKNRAELKPFIHTSPWYVSMISNIVMFTVILFIFGVFIHQESFLSNFIIVLILGQTLNAFDFLVMDLCWWRNTKRTRFSGTEDNKELYKPIQKHFYAFLRGIIAFTIVALIVGGIISLF